jgi:hypothetical protein
MSSKLPYMATPGMIPKILSKIQEARRPERFTQDFLETKLAFSGGSSRPIIPLLKRMGFLSSDGTPTQLYDKFRNNDTQGFATATGIRLAFDELFSRNTYANDLPREKLAGLVTEITGSSKEDTTTKCTVSTFLELAKFADFDAKDIDADHQSSQHKTAQISNVDAEPSKPSEKYTQSASMMQSGLSAEVKLGVSYTINLNLPETTNPEVFNAIFRALKDNLLGQS